MSEDTNNPLYKFMTDNLQLVLHIINVLIRSIFEHFSFTRYGGIFWIFSLRN